MTGELRQLVHGFVAAMLPSPERERYARDGGVDPARWSIVLGLLQLVFGGVLFLVGGLAYMRGGAMAGAGVLIENWWPGLSSQHIRGMGLLNWFAWFLNPLAWPLAYVAAHGFARCVAFVATREAVGDPLIWAAVRAVQRSRRRALDRRFREGLGPWRRDRIVPEGRRGLVVLSSREKPGWRDTVTIEHEGRYFKCVDVELRDDGPWKVLAYRLREEPPGAVIRRLLRYDP